jgi:hypothetical protein
VDFYEKDFLFNIHSINPKDLNETDKKYFTIKIIEAININYYVNYKFLNKKPSTSYSRIDSMILPPNLLFKLLIFLKSNKHLLDNLYLNYLLFLNQISICSII